MVGLHLLLLWSFLLSRGQADQTSESQCFRLGGKADGDPSPLHDHDFSFYRTRSFDDCKKIDGIDRWKKDPSDKEFTGGLQVCCEAAQEFFRCLNTADYSTWQPLVKPFEDEKIPPVENINKFLVCFSDLCACIPI